MITGQSEFRQIGVSSSHLTSIPFSINDGEPLDQEEKSEMDQEQLEARNKLLQRVIKSKHYLNFGYRSYLNYYLKMMFFNSGKFIGRLCCCRKRW